jgi:DNA repair protein RadC
LPDEDKPREKLISKGAAYLSDAELLAILIRTGTKGKTVIEIAQELIQKNKNLYGLADKPIKYFLSVKGLGKDKVTSILAAFEISRRIQMQDKWFSQKQITSPDDLAEIFIPILRDETKEKFIVVCLNSANIIIKYEIITVGILNRSLIHAREIFKVAIENNSANIVLIHNHPSHNINPSQDDINITKRIIEAGKILDILVFDHIIIGGNNFFSFKSQNLI